MNVADLIIELSKLDQSTEVWVDTSGGLFPVTHLYEDSNTTVIIYGDDTEPVTLN